MDRQTDNGQIIVHFIVTFLILISPASSPMTRYDVFLLKLVVTRPPYFLTKSATSSRFNDSPTPVSTNVRPAKQLSAP